ncbi:hypothetical protein SAMN06269185_1170 [Natronoarchaeum philippinense]|uniref:Small CPxCG-related zinc finger protein n=1 Tax=Natronoarchaeum philippinense TaxID=558529 RepID=A0A285NEU6_NATPI|nr:hypothetical protein [Natronoarchaeum philippinense]SNZ06436.1 hypothetical protein SAMN06269185_1170 [Natronoarchaeum philippinense]
MTIAPWSAPTSTDCLHCEAHVSSDFRRVYGDADDRAHRCPRCDTWVRLQEGSGAGLDVPTPDPETSLGRHGGDSAEGWSA